VLIDFFSCQGGSSYGYDQAGFCVVGVDKDPQPLFPFEFVQADALDDFEALIEAYNPWAVVGSPPCQSRSPLQKRTGRDYPELVPPFRRKLIASGLPYVIENVEARPDNPEAVLIDPIMLCGSMFDPAPTVDGLLLKRHRLFESGGGFDLEPLADDSCRKRTGVEWRATINVHGGGRLSRAASSGRLARRPRQQGQQRGGQGAARDRLDDPEGHERVHPAAVRRACRAAADRPPEPGPRGRVSHNREE
jgi:hypothetical protein